ncbi:MAG: ABC transporter permease [Candidatus Bathyarchaeia archaeon]
MKTLPIGSNQNENPIVHEKQSEETPIDYEVTPVTSPKLNTSPLHGLWALTHRDLRKWYKNPIQLFISLIQPVVWLGLFGKAMNFGAFVSGAGGTQAQQNAIMLNMFGTTSYFSFLACGMLSFVILIAVVLGMDTSHFTILGVFGAFSIMFLMAFGLSSLYVMLALRSTDWQTQMAIINLLNLPLVFASNALFPTKLMPTWLQYVVKINPVSYANDAARQLLLGALGLNSLAIDFGYLLAFAILLSTTGIILSWRLLSK